VVAWAQKQSASELFSTAITEAEILYGIEMLGKGNRREGLLAAAQAMLAEDFLGFERDAARDFSRIAAHRRVLGKPISHADAQIAAMTRVHGTN